MREIKFRAWDKEQKSMYIVCCMEWYACGWLGAYSFYTKALVSHPRKDVNVDIELMQYTGLKDKNGVEIYEGDIVVLLDLEHDEELLATSVKWSEQGLNFNVHPCHDPKQGWLVIGNIYENPELLEARNE